MREKLIELVAAPELGLAPSEIGLTGLEITTCLRRAELEIVIRSDRSSDGTANRLARVEVAPEYFHELMCMRCCEWSLKADAQIMERHAVGPADHLAGFPVGELLAE